MSFKLNFNIILTVIIAIILVLTLNNSVLAKLVKDAKGANTVSLNFSQNESFEVNNMLGDIGSDYKIIFKKEEQSASANFFASSGSNVNINVDMSTKSIEIFTGSENWNLGRDGSRYLPVPEGYTREQCNYLIAPSPSKMRSSRGIAIELDYNQTTGEVTECSLYSFDDQSGYDYYHYSLKFKYIIIAKK